MDLWREHPGTRGAGEITCYLLLLITICARYVPGSVVIYYEDSSANLVPVPPHTTLGQAMYNTGFTLQAGTPGFILLVRDSKAHQDFLTKYKVVQ